MLPQLQDPRDAEGDQRASLIAFSTQLIEKAADEGLEVRALGGIAVALRCPSAEPPGPFAREFSDVDLVVRRKSVKKLSKLLTSLGCEPHERFNAANGDTRLLFHLENGDHMDVFVDRFRLCHELPLGDRLQYDDVTVTLADLLLSKLQVAKLSHKDVTDAAALLLDHELSSDETGINVDYVTGILSSDWGWWRTCTETLDRFDELSRSLGVPESEERVIRERIDQLKREIEARPKSLKWKTRARIGDRRPWRVDPDEISH